MLSCEALGILVGVTAEAPPGQTDSHLSRTSLMQEGLLVASSREDSIGSDTPLVLGSTVAENRDTHVIIVMNPRTSIGFWVNDFGAFASRVCALCYEP